MSTKHLAAAATVITVLLWACAFVVIRSVGAVLSPGAMAFVRLLVGSAALALVALRYRRPFPRGRALAFVLGYGVAWFAAYTVVLNWAEQHLDAGTAALLVNVAPILVTVVAGIVFHDGFPRPVIAGMVVAFAGIVLITVGGNGSGAVDSLGIVLGLVTAVLYATGVLMQKVALRSVDHVGLRPRPHRRRTNGGHDAMRPGTRRAAVMGDTRRGAHSARAARRDTVPHRRRDQPQKATRPSCWDRAGPRSGRVNMATA